MIKEFKCYSVICDSCGADVFEDSEFSGFNDKGYVENVADEGDWHKEGDEHYCPKCYEYDDDDNIVIKQPIKKPE